MIFTPSRIRKLINCGEISMEKMKPVFIEVDGLRNHLLGEVTHYSQKSFGRDIE